MCVWGYTQLKNLFQKLNSIMFILNYIIINHTQTKYKQTIVCARALFFCHPSAHFSAMMLSFARWVSEWAKADHLIIQMSTTFFSRARLLLLFDFTMHIVKNAEEEALLSSFVIQRQFRRRRRLFFLSRDCEKYQSFLKSNLLHCFARDLRVGEIDGWFFFSWCCGRKKYGNDGKIIPRADRPSRVAIVWMN